MGWQGAGTIVARQSDRAGRLARVTGQMDNHPVAVDLHWLGGQNAGCDQVWTAQAGVDPLREFADFDALGQRSSWSYQANEPLYQSDVVRDVVGRIENLSWHFGALAYVNRPDHRRAYAYDKRGALVAVTEHDPGRAVPRTWDWAREAAVGGLISIEDRANPEHTLWRTNRNALSGPDGQARARGHRRDEVHVDNATFSVVHDHSASITSALDYDFVYDPYGRLVAAFDALGQP
ncbi:MAG: hypothetical protein H0U74_02535, partial [Bradymonadaceae bacterium]|nr:hypothetical protein [Lujinxingiaceae bacterium]